MTSFCTQAKLSLAKGTIRATVLIPPRPLCGRLLLIWATRSSHDSPLEEAGFEPSVPRTRPSFRQGLMSPLVDCSAIEKSPQRTRDQNEAARLSRDRWIEFCSLQQ
jgi:hypothetical protein